jgi:hypothetical protein
VVDPADLERDPSADLAGAVDDDAVLGEGRRTGNGGAGHLHGRKACAVDGVTQILDASNGNARSAPGLQRPCAGFIGRQAINLPHIQSLCCLVRSRVHRLN